MCTLCVCAICDFLSLTSAAQEGNGYFVFSLLHKYSINIFGVVQPESNVQLTVERIFCQLSLAPSAFGVGCACLCGLPCALNCAEVHPWSPPTEASSTVLFSWTTSETTKNFFREGQMSPRNDGLQSRRQKMYLSFYFDLSICL